MCRLMFTQANSDWWKIEPPTLTSPDDEASDKEEEDEEDEVEELDSLGHLHNELADANFP
jgi:hypothetical protein